MPSYSRLAESKRYTIEEIHKIEDSARLIFHKELASAFVDLHLASISQHYRKILKALSEAYTKLKLPARAQHCDEQYQHLGQFHHLLQVTSMESQEIANHFTPLKSAASLARSDGVDAPFSRKFFHPALRTETAHLSWQFLLSVFFYSLLVTGGFYAYRFFAPDVQIEKTGRLKYFIFLGGSCIPVILFLSLRHLTPLGHLDRGPG